MITEADCLLRDDHDLAKHVSGFRNEKGELRNSIFEIKEGFKQVEQDMEKSDKLGIGFITFRENNFPFDLLSMPDYPLVLCYKGNIRHLNDRFSIAAIGSRWPTAYGIDQGRRYIEYCAGNKYNIISGLAIGCDTVAHQAALSIGGRTTAVLAHGLDTVYPSPNSGLANAIVEQKGLLLSEYFVGTGLTRQNLLSRNRLIAGIAQCTFVLEANLKGGTMHTARIARENKRKVAALWHPDEMSCNPKISGSQLLVEMWEAVPINNYDDLDKLLRAVSAEHYSLDGWHQLPRSVPVVNGNSQQPSSDLIPLSSEEISNRIKSHQKYCNIKK